MLMQDYFIGNRILWFSLRYRFLVLHSEPDRREFCCGFEDKRVTQFARI